MRTIEEIRKEILERTERTMVNLDRLGTFYDTLSAELADIDPSITVDYLDVNIHAFGDKVTLGRVFGALRRLGFSTLERPKADSNQYQSRFTRDDGAQVYLFFTSTVCRKVQVGTRTVEEPIYEIQCGDVTPAEPEPAAPCV